MLKLIPRSEWGARNPRVKTLRTMAAFSTGHWNGDRIVIDGRTTWDHSKCASLVRGVQNFHMDSRGWSDIAYNFVECPHGYTFEGRGLNVVNAANGVNVANQSSHAIMCLAGDGNPFPDAEKIGFREAVRYIADTTEAPDACVGHRDHKATACPGDERYNWIHQGMPTTKPSPFGNWPDKVKATVRRGNYGDTVRYLQMVIDRKGGGNIKVDGFFGFATETRVKDVQKFFGLAADGIVGPRTWSIIDFLAKS